MRTEHDSYSLGTTFTFQLFLPRQSSYITLKKNNFMNSLTLKRGKKDKKTKPDIQN